jgi:hypothetical protein
VLVLWNNAQWIVNTVDKSNKTLNVMNIIWGSPIHNGLNVTRVDVNAISTYHVAKEFFDLIWWNSQFSNLAWIWKTMCACFYMVMTLLILIMLGFDMVSHNMPCAHIGKLGSSYLYIYIRVSYFYSYNFHINQQATMTSITRY